MTAGRECTGLSGSRRLTPGELDVIMNVAAGLVVALGMIADPGSTPAHADQVAPIESIIK